LKKIAGLLAAIAMMATGAASLGCLWIIADEPNTLKELCD
jgi:lipoprotein